MFGNKTRLWLEIDLCGLVCQDRLVCQSRLVYKAEACDFGYKILFDDLYYSTNMKDCCARLVCHLPALGQTQVPQGGGLACRLVCQDRLVYWRLGRCDATLRAWHTQSRCTTNVKLCMHGGGLPCHHHCNFKPWAHRTTTSGTITSHGRCERVAERVHEATTTPLIANTQSHINQTENAAHANKTY